MRCPHCATVLALRELADGGILLAPCTKCGFLVPGGVRVHVEMAAADRPRARRRPRHAERMARH